MHDARNATPDTSDAIVISDAETVVTGDDDNDTQPATPPIVTAKMRTQLCRGKHCRFKRYTMYKMVSWSRATQTLAFWYVNNLTQARRSAKIRAGAKTFFYKSCGGGKNFGRSKLDIFDN